MRYPHEDIEKKWQERWDKDGLFATPSSPDPKRKRYVLDMFPYPSGQGLHVGHPEGYTATDIVSRKLRMEGFDVLHPMGWDAFGLPTENYAIKVGKNPKEIAASNIENFRRQIKRLGFSYDWAREVDTSSPEYYKWTQWLFLLLYKRGLGYRGSAKVNWCPKDQTVLANEQVVNGACERCGSVVEQRELEQWFFKITEYAERLLSGLQGLDWPDRIKAMQKNWIGKSEGARILFRGKTNDGNDFEVPVFTTRPDTLFGVSYIVLAPEHPLVSAIVTKERKKDVEAYIFAARQKTELERTGMEREKEGVPTGAEVAHPLTGESVPVWVADYVLAEYGTGAVMGVPAHDDRDFLFAKKYNLPIKEVVASADYTLHPTPYTLETAYIAPGTLVNSEDFSGLSSEEAKKKITAALAKKKLGEAETHWHLRDWLVSRQRYWGAPIPMIRCEKCGDVPVPEKDLPVTLPNDVDFRPTGESPLARSKSFHDVACPACGAPARRESDTMDTFVDSSWYFLRYTSPNESDRPFDPKAVAAWCPANLYVGGAEHAVLHLLYARFITMVLKDAGELSFDEPFTTLKNQGLILGEDGLKMSKSRGNVVNPDEVVAAHGADTLRLYEMFMGPFEDAKPWSTAGIIGVRRFLEKVYGLVSTHEASPTTHADDSLTRLLHKTVKKVTEDIEAFRFNTAISAMMICANELADTGGRSSRGGATSVDALEMFLKILAPFAPHLAEEAWEKLGHKESIFKESWPTWDPALARETEISLPVQVNGKLRETLTVSPDATEEQVKERALQSANIQKWIESKEIARIVYVPGRLLNFVVKD